MRRIIVTTSSGARIRMPSPRRNHVHLAARKRTNQMNSSIRRMTSPPAASVGQAWYLRTGCCGSAGGVPPAAPAADRGPGQSSPAPSRPALPSAPAKKSTSSVSSPILACNHFRSTAGAASSCPTQDPNRSGDTVSCCAFQAVIWFGCTSTAGPARPCSLPRPPPTPPWP